MMTTIIIIGAAVGSLVVGATGFYWGIKTGMKANPMLPAPPPEATSSAHRASAELRVSGHPEHALPKLHRDLKLLLPEGRRGHAVLSINIVQGWVGLKKKRLTTGSLQGTAGDIYGAIMAYMMDTDSVFTQRGWNDRQKRTSHPLIHGWRDVGGQNDLLWEDSDSPLTFALTVSADPPLVPLSHEPPEAEVEPEPLTLNEKERLMLEAKQEVADLERRGAAARLRREQV
jgi:hypothetical protein